MTPRGHLAVAASALGFARGGMVANDAAIVALSAALDRVGPLLAGDPLEPLHLAACGVVEARLAGDGYAFDRALNLLQLACGRYWSARLAEGAA
jgi:hypothetical protein